MLTKGSRVYCEAALRVETWTDRDGRDRWALSAACWRCEPLGQIGRNRPNKAASGGKRDWQAPAPTDARPASGMAHADEFGGM